MVSSYVDAECAGPRTSLATRYQKQKAQLSQRGRACFVSLNILLSRSLKVIGDSSIR